jgi:hypothetical protein
MYYSGGGTRCADFYDPIPNNVASIPGFTAIGDQKGKSPDFTFSKNVNGYYTFTGMEAFFNDQTTGMQVHLRNAVNPDGTSSPQIVCSRNMSQFFDPKNPAKTIQFSDFLPTVRSVTTDENGKVTSFSIENIGYIYNSNYVHGLSATNCDLSDDKIKIPIDAKICGALSPSAAPAGTFKAGPTIAEMFPYKTKNDLVTVWCYENGVPGACSDPKATKMYQIRYTTTRTSTRYPFSTTTIELVTGFSWTYGVHPNVMKIQAM